MAQRGGGGGMSRKANFLKNILNGDQPTKTSSFLKRKPTLKKKAMELETLCGINVCMVCFDPDGKVDTWPENEEEVKKRCSFYMGLKNKDKKEWSCYDLLQHKKKKLMKKQLKDRKSSNVDLVISSLSSWIDGLSSGDKLRDSVNEFETKIKSFKVRMDYLVLIQQQQQQEQEERTVTPGNYIIEDESEKENDLFSDLSNIQIFQGPTATQLNDRFWTLNNNQQSLGNLEEINYPLLIDNSYLYYNIGLGAEEMQMVSSTNYNANQRRPHSIYDAIAMPSSRSPNLDFGNNDSFAAPAAASTNYVGPVWFNYY